MCLFLSGFASAENVFHHTSMNREPCTAIYHHNYSQTLKERGFQLNLQ